MRSKIIAKWHKVEIQEREISRRGYYIPRTKEGISLILGNTSKKYASRYYRLKVVHGAVGTFLTRIGIIETPEGWWCGAAEQTVEHLYSRCLKWRKQRRKLVRELGKEGIRWQRQVERRWLANLLGEEKAVAGTNTKNFEDNGNRKKRRGKGEGVGLGTEKRTRRWRPAWVSSGGEKPKSRTKL